MDGQTGLPIELEYLCAMVQKNKDQKAILDKLGIKKLNPMQIEAYKTILSNPEVVLLSPTGTGKTLAFLLPLISQLNPKLDGIQVMILVPSRELAIQIEQVIREMGSGYKTNAVYGGRSGTKDKVELKHAPSILVGTPGRVADHIRRGTIEASKIRTLVLDEFDKSLEVGFEKEMKEIVRSLSLLKNRILTSATQKTEIPAFLNMNDVVEINYLGNSNSQLKLKTIEYADLSQLETLAALIRHLGKGRGIVFCNFKDTINDVSNYLEKQHIHHACFYGGMEQIDRERSLIKFRNGTDRILVATDLAARGIDVPELDFIIHFELPFKKEEFVHRNGRTARMNSGGVAFMLTHKSRRLPGFIEGSEVEKINDSKSFEKSPWLTLYISGGRKDKISKGDVAGLFFKQGNLEKHELGTIELKQDCTFVAVNASKANDLIEKLSNSRLKKKKVRITELL